MATINKTGVTVTSGVPDVASIPYNAANRHYIIEKQLDLTGEAITDNDIYQLVPIPANTRVTQVTCRIDTPAVGTSLAIDLGVGGDNSWDDAVNGKATALTYTHSAVGTDSAAASANRGTFYGTADTIDVTMEAAVAITAGPKLTLFVVCEDYN